LKTIVAGPVDACYGVVYALITYSRVYEFHLLFPCQLDFFCS